MNSPRTIIDMAMFPGNDEFRKKKQPSGPQVFFKIGVVKIS